MQKANISKCSTEYNVCLAFYVAVVSVFVSELSRLMFYASISKSVVGCLAPKNNVHGVISETNLKNSWYLGPSSAFGYIYASPIEIQPSFVFQVRAEWDSYGQMLQSSLEQKLFLSFACVTKLMLS